MAEAKTEEDKDVGGGEKEKERTAKQMTGEVCCRNRMSGNQPTLYSSIPDQPDTLCQW